MNQRAMTLLICKLNIIFGGHFRPTADVTPTKRKTSTPKSPATPTQTTPPSKTPPPKIAPKPKPSPKPNGSEVRSDGSFKRTNHSLRSLYSRWHHGLIDGQPITPCFNWPINPQTIANIEVSDCMLSLDSEDCLPCKLSKRHTDNQNSSRWFSVDWQNIYIFFCGLSFA